VSATVGCTAANKIELIKSIKFSSPFVTKNINRVIEDYREKWIIPSSLGMIAVYTPYI
jgi:hypothetical protein